MPINTNDTVLFTTGSNEHGNAFNLAILSETKALRPSEHQIVHIIPVQRTSTRNSLVQTSDAWVFPLYLDELREIGRKSEVINQLGTATKRSMHQYWGNFIESCDNLITIQKHYAQHSVKLSER